MDYYQYQVLCAEDKKEVLIALFSQHPFESFEEYESGFYAYLPLSHFSETIDGELEKLGTIADFRLTKSLIKHQNWNAVWESNFQPIQLDDFCRIRADFHPADSNVKYDIVINPKMAFGTGHHATTYMMMEQMRNLNFSGKRVWDYGCGTGVLAILAHKLGAKTILANDIEEASFENTVENATINQTQSIEALLGDISVISQELRFDIILANINRNVILNSLASLYQRLRPNGQLLLSGVLVEDQDILMEAILAQNFKVINTKQRNTWLCCLVER